MAPGRVLPGEQGTPAQHPAFSCWEALDAARGHRDYEGVQAAPGEHETCFCKKKKKRETDRHKKGKRKRLLRLRAGYLYT